MLQLLNIKIEDDPEAFIEVTGKLAALKNFRNRKK